jgi:hypothetical protein
LDYKKDPTRPGGGVFIAHGPDGEFHDVPAGVIINSGSQGAGDAGDKVQGQSNGNGTVGGDDEGAEDSEGEVVSLVAAAALVPSVSLHDKNHNDHASRNYIPSSPSPFAPVSLLPSSAATSQNYSRQISYPSGSASSNNTHQQPQQRTIDLALDVNYSTRGGSAAVANGGNLMTPVSALRSPVGGANLEQQQSQEHQQRLQQQHQSDLQQLHQQQQALIATGANAAPLVPLNPHTAGARAGHYMNVNPAMNLQALSTSGNVHVMNTLDGSQGSSVNLEALQNADGLLEGIPGGMFDWGMWPFFLCLLYLPLVLLLISV